MIFAAFALLVWLLVTAPRLKRNLNRREINILPLDLHRCTSGCQENTENTSGLPQPQNPSSIVRYKDLLFGEWNLVVFQGFRWSGGGAKTANTS